MIFVIVGPTGSGKSALAEAFASALHLPIINGDAFQVYQDFSIGTAKPSLDIRAKIPHYLFDFYSPEQDYDVKTYQSDLRSVLAFLSSKNQDCVLVGGTGLYIRAGLYDYDFPNEDPVDLSDLANLDDQQLHDYLRQIDPEDALKIHPNNRKRVLRAIAIFRSRGVNKTQWNAQQSHRCLYDAFFLGIDLPREELYQHIDARVESMFGQGLVDESRELVAKYDRSRHAFQGIGYKELLDYFDGKATLAETVEKVKQDSRNYAKRQMTFFRHQLPVTWVHSHAEGLTLLLQKGGNRNG